MKRLLLIGLLVCGPPAQGADALSECLLRAAYRYGIDPFLIWAVKLRESGSRLDYQIIERPRNGSVSRGIMQINSVWDKTLRQAGINPDRLFTDHCLSLRIGAAILAGYIRRHGAWNGIAYYNTGPLTPPADRRYRRLRKIGAAYRASVIQIWRGLLRSEGQ